MQAPQHSVTSSITFIRSAAFDLDRVALERTTMPDGGNGHPVVLYFAGETRHDLDAAAPVGEFMRTAREYLKPDHGCREWKPRRLKAIEVARCRDSGGKVGQLGAFALAMGEGKPLTDAQVEALSDEYGVDELCDVGEAALRASEAPKAAEKKL